MEGKRLEFPLKSNNTSLKITTLESVRGLAACIVVLYHIPKWTQVLDGRPISNAYLMVDLFFVLSGFVMYSAYSGKLDSLSELLRFQFLRLGRLYPVHFLFLFVFAAIEIARRLYLRGTSGGEAESGGGVLDFLLHLFLAQSIVPGRSLTFNYPSWSISAEFITYAIFGVLCLLLRRYRITVFGLIALLAMLLMTAGIDFGFRSMLRCLCGFFLGCLIRRFQDVDFLRCVPLPATLTLCCTTIFLTFKSDSRFDVVIYPLSALLVFALVGQRADPLKLLLQNRFLVWLGSISYSIYMSHAAVIWIVNQVMRFVFKWPQVQASNGHYVTAFSPAGATVSTIVVIAVVLLVSQLVYSYVENPFRQASRSFANRI